MFRSEIDTVTRLPIRHAAIAATLVSSLTACSSGSDQGSSVYDYPAVGAYAGSDFRGSPGSNAFRMAVVGTREYWLLHGDYTNAGFALRGFATGADVVPYPNPYTTGVNFGLPTQSLVNLSTRYDSYSGNLSGTMTTAAPVFTVGFSGVYYTPIGLTVSAVGGQWPLLTDLNGRTVSMNVAAGGGFSATTSASCVFTGVFTNSASVAGLLLVNLDDFGGCLGNPNAYSGVVFLERTAGTGQQQVLMAANNASRTAGVGLSGVR